NPATTRLNARPIANTLPQRRLAETTESIGRISNAFGGLENVATAIRIAATRSELPVCSQPRPRIEAPGATYLNSQLKYASVTTTRLNSSGVVHTRYPGVTDARKNALERSSDTA